MQVYYLIVLEVRSLMKVGWGVFLPEALGEHPFPCFFQLPEAAASLGLWPRMALIPVSFITFSLSDSDPLASFP